MKSFLNLHKKGVGKQNKIKSKNKEENQRSKQGPRTAYM